MRLIYVTAAIAAISLGCGAAFAQPTPSTPTPSAPPASTPPASDPAPASTPAADPPASAPADSTTTPTYGKGWNAKKCADAAAKHKTTKPGDCPATDAPK